MRILFFIQDLGAGGVLRQLDVLASELTDRGHTVSVAAMYTKSSDWTDIWNAGAPPFRTIFDYKTYANIPGPLTLLKAVSGLKRIIASERPDVLYSFAGNAAMLVSWLASLTPDATRLVWGIRGSGQPLKLKSGDLKYMASLRLLAWISRTVPLAIYNSEAGFTFRRSTGHRFRNERIIHNGIDTERFKPDSEARDSLRREWGIKDGEILIGAAGRIVPEKGLDHFIKAAAAIKKAGQRIRVVIAGGGDSEYKRRLDTICAGSGLGGGIVWAGARKDMGRFYSSLDLFCSPSRGEGFPNVVAEAMACGVPCVATDAGDSASIIDRFGIVVPTDNADELARGLIRALRRLPDFDPAELRSSIVSKYSTEKMTASTEAALSELLCR